MKLINYWVFRELSGIFESLIRNIGGSIGRKIRYSYYKRRFESCGSNVIIEEGVFFQNPNFMTFGSNIWIDKNSILIAGPFDNSKRKFKVKGDIKIPFGNLILSDGIHIAPFSLIQSHGGVFIGRNVTIASGSKIYTLSHHYRNLDDKSDLKRYCFSSMAPVEDQYLIVGNVVFEDFSALGINSVILPGAIIPTGTWVGVLMSLSKPLEESNSIFK